MSEFCPLIVKIWLTISSLVCIWDATFILLRPDTLPGGRLHKYWKPYALYIEVDKLYGETSDNFVYFCSILNLFEVFINFVSLGLMYAK